MQDLLSAGVFGHGLVVKDGVLLRGVLLVAKHDAARLAGLLLSFECFGGRCLWTDLGLVVHNVVRSALFL